MPLICLFLDRLDPLIKKYRVRITGLPRGTTAISLENKLGRQNHGEYVVLDDGTSTLSSKESIAYLRGQPLENYVRSYIRRWNDKEYASGIKIKCQAEVDHHDIDDQMQDSTRHDSEPEEDEMSLQSSQDMGRNSQPWSQDSVLPSDDTLLGLNLKATDRDSIGYSEYIRLQLSMRGARTKVTMIFRQRKACFLACSRFHHPQNWSSAIKCRAI